MRGVAGGMGAGVQNQPAAADCRATPHTTQHTCSARATAASDAALGQQRIGLALQKRRILCHLTAPERRKWGEGQRSVRSDKFWGMAAGCK